MNAKQKLTLGIAAIFMVTLTIVGVTYAYFVTQVSGNGTTESVKVQTAKIGVEYGDGNNTVTLTDILPGDVVYKSFTVTNSISEADVNYAIGIEPSVTGTYSFVHATDDTNCYLADSVNHLPESVVTPTGELDISHCFDGSTYDNIYVSLVEVPSTSNVEGDQSSLATLYDTNYITYNSDTKVGKIQDKTKVLATENAIQKFDTQTIEAITTGQTKVKKYVLKIEYAEIEGNQNIETRANLSAKVDLYIPQS